MPPRSRKAGVMITVLDADGNDVTARALIIPAPPVLPVQPEAPDEVPYGSRLASRRQALLQALSAQVWWHTGLESGRQR